MSAGVLLLAALLSGQALAQEPSHWSALEDKRLCDWECMLFTLQWPGSFCVGLNQTHCRIPETVQNWTIHGLWPVKAAYCCPCWPIFYSDLEELDPELSLLWPSLLKAVSSFTFWKQEWIKHGVCAACVEGMNSPSLYFQISLKLRHRFDIDRALAVAGVTPSCNQSYQVSEIHSALVPVLGTVREIQCVKDDKGRELWTQVKIPLFQNLTVGCNMSDQAARSSSTGHPCPENTPLFYYPISYEHPKRPCD